MVNKERTIHFWHGRTPDIVEKVRNLPDVRIEVDNEGAVFKWDGSLDEFEEQYNDKFIVWGDNIYITQFTRFALR